MVQGSLTNICKNNKIRSTERYYLKALCNEKSEAELKGAKSKEPQGRVLQTIIELVLC